MDKYYVDPQWCFDNHEDAAKELERLHKWCDDLEHQRDQLREALEELLNLHDAEVWVKQPWDESMEQARAALKATEEG